MTNIYYRDALGFLDIQFHTYKIPKLTETYASRVLSATNTTLKHWGSEVRGLVLFVGKRSKIWYFQRDVGGTTQRVLIGRFPTVSAQVARQTAIEITLAMSRGIGENFQIGAPTLEVAVETYLARPKLRSEAHKLSIRQQFNNDLKEWFKPPLDEITKAMVVNKHRSMVSKPSTANHTLKYFGVVWNNARRVYDLPESPTMAVEWYVERPSGKIIDDIKAWRGEVDNLANPIHKVFYELLLFTGFQKI